MKKYTEDLTISNKQELNSLLAQRKAPLSEEGLNKALQELTLFMSKEVFFFGALYPKTDKQSESTLACTEIDKADMMEGTDGERYYPVFASIEKRFLENSLVPKLGIFFCFIFHQPPLFSLKFSYFFLLSY